MKPLVLRDGSLTYDSRVAAIESPVDPRDRRVRDYLEMGRKPVEVFWNNDTAFDQLLKGICAATAGGHVITGEPHNRKLFFDGTLGRELLPAHPGFYEGEYVPFTVKLLEEKIYWAAQKIDGFPGGSFPGAGKFMEGTTVRAIAQILLRLDLIGGYVWARNYKEFQLGMSYIGPAMIGIPWFEGFSEPGEDGLMHLSGMKVGYHAVAVLSQALGEKGKATHVIQQSWGPGVGKTINGVAGRIMAKGQLMKELCNRKNAEICFCIPGRGAPIK